MAGPFETVDAYLANFPDETRGKLQAVREAIHRGIAGDAEEKIRYGMAAVLLGGRYALHFAGWKKHVGLYPVPALEDPLQTEVEPYRAEKDSVVFLYSAPIPYDLIERIACAVAAKHRTD